MLREEDAVRVKQSVVAYSLRLVASTRGRRSFIIRQIVASTPFRSPTSDASAPQMRRYKLRLQDRGLTRVLRGPERLATETVWNHSRAPQSAW